MLNLRKSQAALEFLMTYGWAFLIMLIAIAAIAYFGVLRPQTLLPDRCIFNPAFDCQGYKITGTSSGAFNLRLSNNGGHTITVTNISLSTKLSSYSCTTPASNPSNWLQGETKDLAWSGCDSDGAGIASGEKGKVMIKIFYYDISAGPTYLQIAEGEVYSAVS